MLEECFGNGPFTFRMNDNGSGPPLLTQVCLERGWKEYNPDSNDINWNLWWRTSGFPINHHKNIYGWQYLNHIPKGSTICRKDNLIRYLRCMRKIYGSIYDFSPNGFNLPLEYTKLAAECNRSQSLNWKRQDQSRFIGNEKPIWICKPVAQSQGKGIFLFKKLSELNYDTNTIVQKYIENPLLIGGYKFDLRLYVCVPSYHPLTIYMYREGLARFGTDKFSLNDLRNPFRHLTNCSINKLGPGYAEMKDRIGSGCKWTLRQLRRYFQQARISDWIIWQKITSLVILTVLSQMNQIPGTINCFEFFGFDVLIDASLKPWLLEVNLSPALSNDCDADYLVKKPMLHDMFDLLGLPLFNTGLLIFNICSEVPKKIEKENDSKNKSKPSLNRTISVLNAAGKWKRRFKTMSAPSVAGTFEEDGGEGGNVASKLRFNSATNRKIMIKMPKVQVDKQNINKCDNKEYPNTWKHNSWGNGKNWTHPTLIEGNWIRIWPMDLGGQVTDRNNNNCNSGDRVINGEVKSMVNKVTKFTKTVKEIAKNHPLATDKELNDFLRQSLSISSEIWLPPV